MFGSKKRKWLSLSLTALAVVIASLVAFNKWANQPSSQAVYVPVEKTVTSAASYQSLKTADFTTKIPAGFKIQQSSNDQQLDISAYSPSSSNEEQIGIVYDALPSNGLAGVPGYQLRTTDTADYQPLHDNSLPAGSVAFQYVGGESMYTVFIIHNGNYIAITVSNGASSDLISLLNQVVGDLIWV